MSRFPSLIIIDSDIQYTTIHVLIKGGRGSGAEGQVYPGGRGSGAEGQVYPGGRGSGAEGQWQPDNREKQFNDGLYRSNIVTHHSDWGGFNLMFFQG